MFIYYLGLFMILQILLADAHIRSSAPKGNSVSWVPRPEVVKEVKHKLVKEVNGIRKPFNFEDLWLRHSHKKHKGTDEDLNETGWWIQGVTKLDFPTINTRHSEVDLNTQNKNQQLKYLLIQRFLRLPKQYIISYVTILGREPGEKTHQRGTDLWLPGIYNSKVHTPQVTDQSEEEEEVKGVGIQEAIALHKESTTESSTWDWEFDDTTQGAEGNVDVSDLLAPQDKRQLNGEKDQEVKDHPVDQSSGGDNGHEVEEQVTAPLLRPPRRKRCILTLLALAEVFGAGATTAAPARLVQKRTGALKKGEEGEEEEEEEEEETTKKPEESSREKVKKKLRQKACRNQLMDWDGKKCVRRASLLNRPG